MTKSLLLVSLLALASCNTIDNFSYSPPSSPTPAAFERVIALPFDSVWSGLIGSVGKTFFAIDNFEKDSGLLTLSFTTNPFSTAVTGGHVAVHFDDSATVAGDAFWTGVRRQATKLQFDGDYADWVQQYLSGSFSGRMNIVVQEESQQSTRVTLNTRFTVTATPQQGSALSATTWSWNSGERATQYVTNKQGQRVARAFQSTGFVEEKIADQLAALEAGGNHPR